MSDDILQRVLAARIVWADLPGKAGKAVRFTRPGLDEQYRLLEAKGTERIRGYLGLVNDWRGFVEADAIKGGDQLTLIAFSPELLFAMCEDNGDLLAAVLDALKTKRSQMSEAEAAETGNSPPS